MTENEIRELIRRVRSNRYLMRSETDYITKALEEVQQYRSIGTPEECRAAMERQNPRAAITEKEDAGTTRYICPTCGMYMGWSTGTFPARYCWKCGQKLDWGDEE
nr:MAG TPA: ribosome, girodazole, girolline, antibiotic complex, 50S [Caudoviricetes sp.]